MKRIKKNNNMKHHSIKIITALLGFMLPLAAVAQTAVVASGGRAENAAHQVSYSVGQIAVGNGNTTAHGLSEGVLQPLIIEEVGIDNPPLSTLNSPLSVFPNPTTGGITIRTAGEAPAYHLRLYTLDGRLLHTEQWGGTTLTINLNAYPAGVYMLQVNNKTYKITKQ